MTEQQALQVLNAAPSLGAVRIRKLLLGFGHAMGVLEARPDLINFSKDKFLEDEYNLSSGKSKLIYVKTSQSREEKLNTLFSLIWGNRWVALSIGPATNNGKKLTKTA